MIDLQSQVAFQEDMLQELNSVVTRQQTQIDDLKRECALLAEKLADLAVRVPDDSATGAEEERPPHY
jgi:SlyX protein